MTTKDLTALLMQRYSGLEYAFLTQVRNGTGNNYSRTADGIAMSLFNSRGLFLHGFEIKVSRSDWLKELHKPDKAEEIGKYCHYWWIVAPDIKTVKPEELPDTWGLLVENNGKLVIAKKSTFMKPVPITYAFLAGILRRTKDSTVPLAFLEEQITSRANEIVKSNEYRERWRLDECEKLERKIKMFEERSGLKIDDWNLGDVADAVRVIKESQSENHFRRLQDIKHTAESIIEAVNKAYEKDSK